MGYVARMHWGNHREMFVSFDAEAVRTGVPCESARFLGNHRDFVVSDKSSPFADWLAVLPKPAGILAASDRFAAAHRWISWWNN